MDRGPGRGDRRIEPLADDSGFQSEWRGVKADNKRALAAIIKDRTGTIVDAESLFDIQVKRLHEYKRQHLNVLYLVTLYNRLIRHAESATVPRTVIFAAKPPRLSHGEADHPTD